MGKCEFNANSCSVECKKYQICSYYSIQSQISEIQRQLNFLYRVIPEILSSNEEASKKIELLEEGLFKFGMDLYKDKGENNEEID